MKMKKAISILILLSKIFSILFCVLYVILAIVNFVNAGKAPDAQTQSSLISGGVSDIFYLSFAVAAVIVTYTKGQLFLDDKANKVDAILAIVFGVLGCPTLTAAGIVYLVWMNCRKAPVEEPAPEPAAIEAPEEKPEE